MKPVESRSRSIINQNTALDEPPRPFSQAATLGIRSESAQPSSTTVAPSPVDSPSFQDGALLGPTPNASDHNDVTSACLQTPFIPCRSTRRGSWNVSRRFTLSWHTQTGLSLNREFILFHFTSDYIPLPGTPSRSSPSPSPSAPALLQPFKLTPLKPTSHVPRRASRDGPHNAAPLQHPGLRSFPPPLLA
jgi:hypothetical protein